MNSNALKRLVPLVIISCAVVAFAALTWLGQGNNSGVQYRPTLAAEFTYSEDDRVQRQAIEDIIYRMQTHHEYRVATHTDLASVATVQVAVTRENGTIIFRARIVNAAGEASGEPDIVVEGPAEVALTLSGKVFSLLNTQLRNLAIVG